jgi:hypothetical protein
LFNWHNQAILPPSGRPLGECRFSVMDTGNYYLETIMRTFSLVLSALVLTGCVQNGRLYNADLSLEPRFASSNTSFRYYQAYPEGEVFELHRASSGEAFVMTYLRNSATLVLLIPVPMNLQYGMMLDENLCSNGLAAHRQMNWPEGRYGINIEPRDLTNVNRSVPVGVCFTERR